MAFTFPSISSITNAIVQRAQQTAGAIGATAQANLNYANQAYLQPTIRAITPVAQQAANTVNQSRLVQVPASLAATAGANINLARVQGQDIINTLANSTRIPTQTNTYNPTTNTYGAPVTVTTNPSDYRQSIQPEGTATTQTIPGVQSPTFDYTKAQTTAYEALKPFYEKLLSFTGGRLDLAKRMLEYSYSQGLREATQENEQAAKELALAKEKENANIISDLNKRGVYNSGFGKADIASLKSSQELRALAIQRALENKTSRLEAERGFGTEEANRTAEQEKLNLERQRRSEADTMAAQQYAMKSDKYGAELANQGLTEQQRVQGLTNQATAGALGGTTGTTGTTSAKTNTAGKTFEQYMAETGRQPELDVATHGATQQGAEYLALRKKYGF